MAVLTSSEKCTRAIILFIALFNIALHLAFRGNLEYHRDEMLYFSLGLHPAFGYATVPPMIGWIAMIVHHLFGFSLFAVRIVPALMGGIMVVLTAGIAKEMGGNRYARILAATGMVISIFGLRTFFLYQPVHIDLFFWTLAFYLIIRYINSEAGKYLFWFGLTAGLALLNKYLIGLLFVAILAVIPFTVHRKMFRNKMFWYGIAGGFILFLPNLIWQISNGMPLFSHLSELASTQLAHVSRGTFLIEQAVIPGASAFLTIAGLIFLLGNKKAVKYRPVAFIVLIIFLSLMILRGKSYYTQGVFPLLISAGAVCYEMMFRKWYLRALLMIMLLLIALALLPFGMPVCKTDRLIGYFNGIESKYGIDLGRTFEDGSKHSLPQDYADMLGWEELASIAAAAWGKIPDKEAAFIYCENYGQASAITLIGKKYGLPEAVCFSESFRFWFPQKFNPDIQSLIYINSELGTDISRLFTRIQKIGAISDPDAREYRTSVWLCEDPVMSFNEFWQSRLEELKRQEENN